MRPGYIAIPQHTTEFSQLVSRIEKNLSNVYGIRTKAPSIMDRLFKEHENRQLLKLFLETRDLLVATDESQKRIPMLIRSSNAAFAAKIATEFSSPLQQWISGQRQKAIAAHQTTLQKKNQLESEHKQI